ncbi:MAG: antibiotic biosynthesis monooxygenase [Selenomonadaceae bacterium]|nr:antibiotic biosynthesis monooxygenase [Selenomonadaceae bacterium]
MATSLANAHPIRTPEGNMPMVHWAVLESTPGNMQKMGAIGAKTVGPQTAKEMGTYVLYGGIDATNHDLMRLLEIYEGYEAYRIHSTSEAFQEYRAARFPILKSLKILEANGIALEQKESGTATVVFMHRYEVVPEKLLEYQHLATAEAVRSVREEDGVMGMFVTAEHDNPNIIHTMELYRDRVAYEAYSASKACQDLQKKTAPMLISSHTVENLATNIPLSSKGLHVER